MKTKKNLTLTTLVLAVLFFTGGHDFLVEQNWINDRKGRCALSQ